MTALVTILIGIGLLNTMPERSLPVSDVLPEPAVAISGARSSEEAGPVAIIGQPQLRWRPATGLEHAVSATAPVRIGDQYLLMANIGSAIGFSSTDGLTWSRTWPLSPAEGRAVVIDLVAAGETPVAVGWRGEPPLPTVWSRDGEFGWSEQVLTGEGLLPLSISWSEGNLVIAAHSIADTGPVGHLWWSSDGEGWELLEIPTSDASAGFTVIPIPGGGFRAVLPDGELWSSDDGRVWGYRWFAGVQWAVQWGDRLVGANDFGAHLSLAELSDGRRSEFIPADLMPERRTFWRVGGLAAEQELGILAIVHTQLFRNSEPWSALVHSTDGKEWSRVSVEEITGMVAVAEMVAVTDQFALLAVRQPDHKSVEVFVGTLENG